MGIFENINDTTNLIHYGTRSDICELCRRELAVEEPNLTLFGLNNKLKGKLTGKKVFKTRHSGADLVICMDHIKKIADEDTESNNTKTTKEKKKDK